MTKNGEISWQPANDGQVLWSLDCDFDGHDIGNVNVHGGQCGAACLANKDCTTFTWTPYQGGTCYLKNGGDPKPAQSAFCGKIVKRNHKGLGKCFRSIVF